MHSYLMKGGYNPQSSGRSVSSDSGATAALGCARNVRVVELGGGGVSVTKRCLEAGQAR